VIAGGDVDPVEAGVYVERLAVHWPAIVLRVPNRTSVARTAPVLPLVHGILRLTVPGAAVWQPVHGATDPPGPGPVLPRLPGRTARALLAGRLPGRSRWIRAWQPVWDLPWA
jgi:hypothetical protein